MDDVIGAMANKLNNVEVTQWQCESDPNIQTEAVDDDIDDLPEVHCGLFELIPEPPRKRVDGAAPRQSAAADSEIKVIVGGSQSTRDDLFPGPRTVLSFDDVTFDDYHDRFPTCFVIPTTGGANAYQFATFAEDEADIQSSPTFADFDRPLPDRVASVISGTADAPSCRLRRRAAAAATAAAKYSNLPEKQESEVLRREFGRRDDGGNLDDDGGFGDDDEDDVTTEVSRRQFHGGGRFVRYRYPKKFHRSASATDLISAAEVCNCGKDYCTCLLRWMD